ncbi:MULTISPECIES: hypothetical protein [unclassified Kitasatospora]
MPKTLTHLDLELFSTRGPIEWSELTRSFARRIGDALVRVPLADPS